MGQGPRVESRNSLKPSRRRSSSIETAEEEPCGCNVFGVYLLPYMGPGPLRTLAKVRVAGSKSRRPLQGTTQAPAPACADPPKDAFLRVPKGSERRNRPAGGFLTPAAPRFSRRFPQRY